MPRRGLRGLCSPPSRQKHRSNKLPRHYGMYDHSPEHKFIYCTPLISLLRDQKAEKKWRKMNHRLRQHHMQMGQTNPTIRKFLRRKVASPAPALDHYHDNPLAASCCIVGQNPPYAYRCRSADVLEVRWGFKSRCVTIIVLVSPEIERKGTLLRRSVGADAITGVGANEPQYLQGAALPGKP